MSEQQRVSEELLLLLACPVCGKKVELRQEHLICSDCGRKYPIRDGIPDMMVEDGEYPEKR